MVMLMVGAFCFVAGLAVGAFVILMEDDGTTDE